MIDPIQFIVNERGKKTAVIIRTDEYKQILEKLETLRAAVRHEAVKNSGDAGSRSKKRLRNSRRSR